MKSPSGMNLNVFVDNYNDNKSDIPYDGYLGLEEKKPTKYLKPKAVENISYEFRIGLGELLSPINNKFNEVHISVFNSKSLYTKKLNSKSKKQSIEKNKPFQSPHKASANTKVRPYKSNVLQISRILPKTARKLQKLHSQKGNKQVKDLEPLKKLSSK
ncbi:13341_t:CDS:1 [Ambispora gerdemannii]|uniref:13341_t:CDS:1 n=1 Tax=Ambispora gerdemannii TaxID=144530 RepID=A0A9N8YPH1_9GLOM|nr:13341_t:CDS:1 [Ambispora gerdemannii]